MSNNEIRVTTNREIIVSPENINNIMSREQLETNIILWADDKNLLPKSNVRNQYIKLVEEVGELAKALLKEDEETIIDSIGDIEVVLTILKKQLGYSQHMPLLSAWNEIKDRKGKTEGGVFKKNDER